MSENKEIKPSSDSPALAGSSSVVASNLETANLIDGYHVIAEWIRFADAKAAVILTVGGAIAGLVIPTLKGYLMETKAHPTMWWNTFVSVLFALWLLLTLLSGIWAFRCISPYRRNGRHPASGSVPIFIRLQSVQHSRWRIPTDSSTNAKVWGMRDFGRKSLPVY